MSTRGSNKVSHRPDINDKATFYRKQKSSNRNISSESAENCRFKLPKRSEFSLVRFLKHFGDKVATAIRLVPLRRRHSYEVSSLGRSKTFTTVDPHRTEAIEDCIQFINSSSSLSRSNSVTTYSC